MSDIELCECYFDPQSRKSVQDCHERRLRRCLTNDHVALESYAVDSQPSVLDKLHDFHCAIGFVAVEFETEIIVVKFGSWVGLCCCFK